MTHQPEKPSHLYSVIIPEEYLSRGTGEQLPLAETCVYDFMPPILGSQFMTNGYLRGRAYFYGEGCGPFLATEDAYTAAAKEALHHGDIEDALEAYKAALHSAVQFYSAVQLMQGLALLNSAELSRLDLSRFQQLEYRLIQELGAVELVDLAAYNDFVRGIGRDKQRSKDLNRTFFGGFDSWMKFRNGGPEPDLASEYIALLAKMGDYKTAAQYADAMGWSVESEQYKALIGQQPKDSARMEKHRQRVIAERDAAERARGY